MKIRIKFAKTGMMRFIGHLDMMRYFQKAMRRAEIDIAYSEGYSPHQIMSFAAPLGMGITSEGEYLDIEVHSSKSSKDALKALNEVMAEGILVLQYRQLKEGTKNAMSSVAAADYLVTCKNAALDADFGSLTPSEDMPGAGDDRPKESFGFAEVSEALQKFYQGQNEILITKQTKKGERIMDLKPLTYELEAVDVKGHPGFFLKVSAGSTDNVKPELVLEAFSDYCKNTGACDFKFDAIKMQIHRLEVYAREGERFVPLGDLGKDIICHTN